jgi:aspartate kinase
MIVMKFGGSSVKDAAAVDRVAGIIETRREAQPVIVVSALGRTTDTLVEILDALDSGGARRARGLLARLRIHHEDVIAAVVGGEEEREEAMTALEGGLTTLERLVEGMELLGEVSPRSRDAVLASGELMAAPLLAAALRCRGLPAVFVDPREVVVTDETHEGARPDLDECAGRTVEELVPHIEEGRLPVLGGYVGCTPEGTTTTLGRGGSDLTASIIARGLRAQRLEYWKDVDGILTADPTMVEGARVVERLSFEEAAELAFLGAQVFHPAAIQPAVEAGVPVRVLNSYRPEAPGTLIERGGQEGPHADPRAAVVSIASKSDQFLLNLYSTRMLGARGFLRKVFEVFENLDISVDHIATSEVNVSVTLAPTDRADDLASILAEVAEVEIKEHMGVVSVVGDRLSVTPGVAGTIFEALSHVNVHLITHGGSGVNLSFVVDSDEVKGVVGRLHEALFAHQE